MNQQAATDKLITIEYELGSEDLLANLAHYRKARYGRSLILIRWSQITALVVVVGAIPALLLIGGSDVALFIVMLSVMAALILLNLVFAEFGWRLLIRLAKRRAATPVRIKHSVSIGPGGIADVTNSGERKIHWRAIEYVSPPEQYLYLQARGLEPLIVPRRAFSDESAFIRFCEAVKAFQRNAASQAPDR